MRWPVLVGALALASVAPSFAASAGAHSTRAAPHVSESSGRAAAGVPRDAHGRIARSGKARTDFRKEHPCPSTGKATGACPGYVIDHVVPLKRGGADAPSNMQWQTEAAAKAKDQWE